MTMRSNIFREEFKMQWRSVIIWSLAIAALLFLYLSMFSSFAGDAALLNEMMSNFPKELLTAFGMSNIDLSAVLGYFGLAFLFAQICLAIQAAGYGFSLVSIEEREWTADFLLTKPVGRAQILTSKLLAALASLAITDAVVWGSSLAALALFAGDKAYEAKSLLLLLLSVVPFQLFFLAVGLAVSLLVKRIRSAFGDLLGDSVLEKITPFKHFSPRYIVQHAAYDTPLVAISLAVILISLAASYVLYSRRDIPAVV
jgi:ABC-2 type transport system permease protein